MIKLLTISIAAYNVENYISFCLESLIHCTCLDKLDIIIVNDGSNDNTEAIAESYRKRYPDSIRIITKERGGHGSTINTSIRNLKGKYFKILDADDWVESENLDLLVDFLSTTDVDLIFNSYYQVNASDRNDKKLCYPYYEAPFSNKRIQSMTDFDENLFPNAHAMTFRSEIIQKQGLDIDENCYYVDAEYEILPLKYVHTTTILNYPIYDFLVGTTSQSVNIGNMRLRNEEHLRVIKRLVDYYELEKNVLSTGFRDMIKKRIAGMIKKQYYLYMGFEPKTAKQLTMTFDIWLKEHSAEMYKDSLKLGKYPLLSMLFGFIQKTKYKPYIPAVWIVQKIIS